MRYRMINNHMIPDDTIDAVGYDTVFFGTIPCGTIQHI